jgi:transcriptional regulator with XRE-family HTH domain
MEVKNIKTIVGNNLKYARKQKELQKEVAALLRKYQPDYSQYQTGAIELDYEKIVYLCKLFDITPNELFEGLFD